MAEIIGLIAAVSQLTCMAAQLRGLWDQFDQVPARLTDLVDQIQLLSPMLLEAQVQIEHSILCSSDVPSSSVLRSTTYCLDAHAALSEVIVALNEQLNTPRWLKRKFATAKAVLNRNNVQYLETKLRRAECLLQMSLQIYNLAYSKTFSEQTTKILALLQKDLGKLHPIQQVCLHTQISRHDHRQKGFAGVTPRILQTENQFLGYSSSRFDDRYCEVDYKVVLRPLSWLIWMTSGVELRVTMRQYNVRPSDSIIFKLVKLGDLQGMLRLFNQHQASPFDRDDKGLSLLHYATATNHVAICQALVDFGLHTCIDEEVHLYFSPREMTLFNPLSYSEDTASGLAYMDLFHGFMPTTSPATDCRILVYGCSIETNDLTLMKHFQGCVAPLFFTLPLPQRMEAVRGYCFSGRSKQHPHPNVLNFLVGGDEALRTSATCTFTQGNRSIIHSSAIAFGRACRRIAEATLESVEQTTTKWRQHFGQMLDLCHPEDIHAVENIRHDYSITMDWLIDTPGWVGTPLVSLLKGAFLDDIVEHSAGAMPNSSLGWRSILHWTLRQWLETLSSHGVDLLKYGEIEHEAFGKNSERGLEFTLTFSRWSSSTLVFENSQLLVVLRGFEYGLHAQDWVLHWDVDAEQLAGEFWARIEPEQPKVPVMPGTWRD